MNYRQCRLQKKIPNGVREQVSFIPEPFCREGKILKLRDEDGNWENGWKVIFASENSHTEEETQFQQAAGRAYNGNKM